jgi:hypothetical protein
MSNLEVQLVALGRVHALVKKNREIKKENVVR